MTSQFYTFYDFTYHQGYPPFRALVQSQLKNSINNLTKVHQEWSEANFIEHFRQIILNDSLVKSEKRLAHWHFVAFIDKSRCYLIWREYNQLPFYAAQSENFYSLTNEVLFNLDKFQKHLHKYNFQHQSKASFTTYISGVLKNSLREKLDNSESDWHLLCNVDTSSTRKMKNFAHKLREALNRYGIAEPSISQYIFAWQYFVPIYKINNIYPSDNSGNRWKNPQDSDFLEAANQYKIQKNQPNAPLQVSPSFKVTSAIIKEWMETCIQALRQYQKIAEVSRDDINYNESQEVNSICSPIEENLLVHIDQILQEEIEHIENSLPSIHKKIPLTISRAIMLLYYPCHLAIFNQQELSKWLEIDQATISRYISNKIQKPLLKRFNNTLVDHFNILSYIDDFLETRFSNPNNTMLDIMLSESFFDLEARQKKIFKLFYGSKKTLFEVQTLLNDTSINNARIQDIKIKLQTIFQIKINKWQKLYIKIWLQKYYRNIITKVLLKGFTTLEKFKQEIITKQYCEKLNEGEISKMYPEYEVSLILKEAKNQLKVFLTDWFLSRYQIVLELEGNKILEIIESWLLKELIYLEM